MRITGMGHVVFAAAICGLGVLSLLSGDFAYVWQPVPQGIPWRESFAYLSGAIMFATGLGLFFKRTVTPASFVLTVYSLVWLLVLHVPHVVATPSQEVTWGGCAEILTLVAGGWILYTSVAVPHDRFYFDFLTGTKAMHIAQCLFALALPLIGLEHLIYAQPTADMVPAWLPDRLGLAYMTGIAHIAAGVAIFFAILPRLAAALETLMMGIFTLFVWVPMVASTPAQRFAWTGLLISTAITAAAWIVADSYRGTSWFSFGRSHR